MTVVATVPPPVAESPYAGFVTRTLGFAIDAAVITGVAAVVGGIAFLVNSIIPLPEELKPIALAIGGAAYVIWTIAYFAAFWASTGQTPGARVMGHRVVVAETGKKLRPRVAVRRFLAMVLAFLPLGLGFLPVLTDERRRGLHDRLAGTVVLVDEPKVSPRSR